MKKILLIVLCAIPLVSCASKRAAMVDNSITEAKTLQVLAKAQGLEVPASIDSLITAADKQNSERQTEDAFILSDEAVLHLQLALLKKEYETIVADNKNATESLESSKKSLEVYRNVLNERRNAPKEQVIQ